MTLPDGLKAINQARFDALTYSRLPMVNLFLDQLEWVADNSEIIISVLVMDKIDNDWGYITLGRDERSLFRAIDGGISFLTIEEARDALVDNIIAHLTSGEMVFPQGDKSRRKNEIYRLQVKQDRQHPIFMRLSSEFSHIAAKEIIREIVFAFEDPDGNYIKDFQSTGFNARLWELYLYAYLHEENFDLPRSDAAPDYMCNKFGDTVFIEAVTVNPTANVPEEPIPQNSEEVRERLRDYMPIKFGSPLTTKLGKRYWEKPHVQGHPLIFAIQDFHQEGSLLWSRMALLHYLYAVRHTSHHDDEGNLIIIPEYIKEHVYKGKTIPSGFFLLPESENVSAVLFSNSATIAKFNRMGKLAGFGAPNIMMIREGEYHDHDPNAADPLPFEVMVDPDNYSETWSEGLTMFHNPKALFPVDPDLFPSIAHCFFEDGQIRSLLPDFYPYWSITRIGVFGQTDESVDKSEVK